MDDRSVCSTIFGQHRWGSCTSNWRSTPRYPGPHHVHDTLRVRRKDDLSISVFTRNHLTGVQDPLPIDTPCSLSLEATLSLDSRSLHLSRYFWPDVI